MLFCAAFAAIIGVLSASAIRPDGTTACDPALRPAVITADNTVFSSLGYDGTTPYAPDLLCEYQFTAPTAADNVILSITDFLVEECTDCGCDYLEVYDGPDDTGTLVGTYCTSAIPGTLTGGQNMFLRFVTDATTHGAGFQGTYTSGNAACEGGVVLTAMNGTFTTPGYPASYPLNADCTWTFRPPMGNYRAEIWFDDFALENSCSYDTVDMVHADGGRMNKWYGNFPADPAARFLSYAGEGDVDISFTTDQSVRDTGFQAHWQFVLV